MIKAVVFDFDKVLHLTDDLFSLYAMREYDLSPEDVKEFFTKEYSLCRVGKLDIKKTLKDYLPRMGWKGTVEDFMKTWFEYGRFDERVINLISKLKERGIICILCTNNEKYRIRYYAENYRLNEIFDHVLVSGELGFLKPDKEMLEKIVKVAGVKKEEILLCDDKESFIEIVRSFGFKTYLYDNFDNFKAYLEKIKAL